VGEVGRGEDLHHTLPDVQSGRYAGFRQQIGWSPRVVEQDLVVADVKLDRGPSGRVALLGAGRIQGDTRLLCTFLSQIESSEITEITVT
jgi:hypothetical protein